MHTVDYPCNQKNFRNPNHHYFSKSIAIHLQFVLQSASNWYCRVLSVPLTSQESEIHQYASHLYRSTLPICIAVLLGKSWWLWSLGCSPAVKLSLLSQLVYTEGGGCQTLLPAWALCMHCSLYRISLQGKGGFTSVTPVTTTTGVCAAAIFQPKQLHQEFWQVFRILRLLFFELIVPAIAVFSANLCWRVQ